MDEIPDLPDCRRPGCGHEPDLHSLDDAQNVSPVDPEAKFRCRVGLSASDRQEPCGCPDYLRSFS